MNEGGMAMLRNLQPSVDVRGWIRVLILRDVVEAFALELVTRRDQVILELQIGPSFYGINVAIKPIQIVEQRLESCAGGSVTRIASRRYMMKAQARKSARG